MQCNPPATKPQVTAFFFIRSRFPLKQILEVWTLKTPDLWECIKIFHERQISVMPRFCLEGFQCTKYLKEILWGTNHYSSDTHLVQLTPIWRLLQAQKEIQLEIFPLQLRSAFL